MITKRLFLCSRWAYYMLIFTILCYSCKKGAPENTVASNPGNPTNPTAQAIMVVDHAFGFSFEYHPNYKILNIHNHFQPKKDTTRYILIRKGESVPEGYDQRQIIHIPVQKVVLMSTTQIALFDAIDELSSIAALSSTNFLWNKILRQAVAEGKVQEVGRAANLNLEEVINLQPDLVMAVGFPEVQHQTYNLVQEAGIPVIFNSEWQEKSVLGRAEWLKVAAILTAKEKEANQFFQYAVATYESLKSLTRNIENKPLILNNLPHRGTWYVPGGNSYVAELIRDAGGNYPWPENQDTGSSIVSFEEIYRVGLVADIWMDPGVCQSLEEIEATDNRVTAFEPYQTGRVYMCNKRTHPEKGNDYWERGIVLPHTILADYIHIMHPEILPDHELYFYQKLD